MVINNFSRSEQVHSQTSAYFEVFPDRQTEIVDHIFAYKEIGEAIPQNTKNFGSGHHFPFVLSEYEIESSFNLAMQGFYTYSLIALRSVLELGLLGLYFAVEGKEEIDVRPWIFSFQRTPRRKQMFDKLLKIYRYKEFDNQFDLFGKIRTTFDQLDKHVHTRGFNYSSRKLTLVNYNYFREDSLLLYSNHLSSVTHHVIVSTILMYPVAMQPLPLTEKFGLQPPFGGLLEEYQINRFVKVLDKDQVKLLRQISDRDPETQEMVNRIRSMPDLTDEEWESQRKSGGRGFTLLGTNGQEDEIIFDDLHPEE